MLSQEEKLKIKNSSILLSFIVVLCAILVLLILLPRGIHTKRIIETLNVVLEQNDAERYTIGNRVFLKSNLEESTYVFEVNDSLNPGKNYVILTRIIGLNGPVPVVFVGNSTDLKYCGIAGLNDTQQSAFIHGLSEYAMDFWEDKLKSVLEKELK
ncbi:MAG: hypothetical protein SPI86_08940 [Treponemataceae bacterium]|nr:hypothetical protein [Spirochaetales bacterium]MDY6031867.1 hypothetical protein [Treponemataceae bacterium]